VPDKISVPSVPSRFPDRTHFLSISAIAVTGKR
jgi:hypothetical protein